MSLQKLKSSAGSITPRSQADHALNIVQHARQHSIGAVVSIVPQMTYYG